MARTSPGHGWLGAAALAASTSSGGSNGEIPNLCPVVHACSTEEEGVGASVAAFLQRQPHSGCGSLGWVRLSDGIGRQRPGEGMAGATAAGPLPATPPGGSSVRDSGEGAKEEKELFQEINSYSSLESEKSWDDLQKTKHSETELSHLCSSHQKELSGQVDSLAHESCCIANHRMRNTHWQR